MNKLKKIAVSICAVISLCPVINVSAELSPEQNNCPDFSQIKELECDHTAFENAYNALEKIAEKGNKNKFGEVKKLLKVLIEEYSHIQTMENIYSINYYSDVTNQNANKKLVDLQNMQFECFNDITQCAIDLYNAGFEDDLRDVSGYDLIEIFLEDNDDDISDEEYEKLLDKNDSLINQANDIVNKYYGYTEDDFSVEYKGKTWILNDLIENPPEDDNDYREISKLIYDKRNNILGSLYLQLIDVRNQIAQLHGYNNYAEYAYEELYIMDYSLEDTNKIYQNVKKYFADNYEYFSDEATMSAYNSGLLDMEFSGDELLNKVSPFFNQLDPEIAERFNHMKEHHLYDIDDDGVKSGESFTDSLFDYSVPFVFITPQGSYNDLISIIHEFGHANSEYAKPSSAIENEDGSSLDTGEMHSQGMEILFTHYSQQILGEEAGRAFNQNIIRDLFDSIIQGCLFDEFQKYAYENPKCSLEDLNRKYKELSSEYGIEYSEYDPYLYDWVEISHNYDSPMYYITYATSAASVLDLWIQSMDDMDAAINMYKKVVECDLYTPYKETAEKCGLSTIFDEDALKEISYQTEYYFENDTIDKSYSATEVQHKSSSPAISSNLANSNTTFATATIAYNKTLEKRIDTAKNITHMMLIPLGAASATYIIGLIIAVLVIRHSDKKRKERRNEDSSPFL